MSAIFAVYAVGMFVNYCCAQFAESGGHVTWYVESANACLSVENPSFVVCQWLRHVASAVESGAIFVVRTRLFLLLTAVVTWVLIDNVSLTIIRGSLVVVRSLLQSVERVYAIVAGVHRGRWCFVQP